MKLTYSIIGVISLLCLTTTMAQQISWSRPGCQDKCGNVIIAYPFGIGPECSANSSFTVTCNSSTGTLFLSSFNLQVLNISVHGAVVVNLPVSPMSCSERITENVMPISLAGSPFTISARYNSLVVLGCTNSVWLLANETTRVAGCLAICEANNNSTEYSSCRGLNCCNAPIPPRLQSFRYSYQSIQSSNDNDSFCGYAFPVDKKWLRHDYQRYRGLHSNQSFPYDQEFVSAPLVLEWELDNPMLHNPEKQESNLCRYADDYRYFSSYGDEYIDASTSLRAGYYSSRHELVSSIKYCSCGGGSEGNPYLLGGCIDINECALNSTDQCSLGMICINMNGGYRCNYPKRDSNISKANIAFISIGSALGGVILLYGAWMSARAIRKRIKAKRRQVFFKRNGGLLLQQQLSSTDSSLEKLSCSVTRSWLKLPITIMRIAYSVMVAKLPSTKEC